MSFGPVVLRELISESTGLRASLEEVYPSATGGLLEFSSGLVFSLNSSLRVLESMGMRGVESLAGLLTEEKCGDFYRLFGRGMRSLSDLALSMEAPPGSTLFISGSRLLPVCLEDGGLGEAGLPPSDERRLGEGGTPPPALYMYEEGLGLERFREILRDNPDRRVLVCSTNGAGSEGLLREAGMNPILGDSSLPDGELLSSGAVYVRGEAFPVKLYKGGLCGMAPPKAAGSGMEGGWGTSAPPEGLQRVLLASSDFRQSFDLRHARAAHYAEAVHRVLMKRLEAFEPPGRGLKPFERRFMVFLSLVFAVRFRHSVFAARSSEEFFPEGLLEEFRRLLRLTVSGESLLTSVSQRVRQTLMALGASDESLKLMDRGQDPLSDGRRLSRFPWK
jgi:hypothetical protein